MSDTIKIAKIVKAVLASDFVDVKIVDVRVRDDFDSDGDEVLRVDVIFDGSPKDLDANSLIGAVRHVRPKLFEAQEKGFPVFSFISNRETGMKAFEAA